MSTISQSFEPRFSGLRKAVFQRETPFSQAGFDRLYDCNHSDVIGKLPGDLAKTFENPRDFLRGLSEVSDAIRSQRRIEGDYPQHISFHAGDVPVRLKQLGKGALGVAYEVKAGKQSTVLKIYHRLDAGEEDTKMGLGNRAEQRIGLTLSKIRFKTLSTFHVGNPNKGWALYERFTPDMDFHARPGEFLEDYDVMLTDHDEFIDGIKGRGRVDHGGIILDAKRPLQKHRFPWSEMCGLTPKSKPEKTAKES